MVLWSSTPRVRRAIRIHGKVQGVGFRPSIYRRAVELGLCGFVRNDGHSVLIEAEGTIDSVERFQGELSRIQPPSARIDRIETTERPLAMDVSFEIAGSAGAKKSGPPAIPPDLAPCQACLEELSRAGNRRHRYPFVNCTLCGPRYTIVRDAPYDRVRTSMSSFSLCARCRREYRDPQDRRFHAEPNACPDCGPRLTLFVRGREWETGDAALAVATRMLTGGSIVAVKGVGGYLLATDATSEAAVARLREKKRRPDKPFAVMARDVDAADEVAAINARACVLLSSPARPILILPSKGSLLAESVAPRLTEVGLFLPPSPLQQLLAIDGPPLQVMTSGNLAGEPIVKEDGEALERLGSIADAVLVHDRRIVARADDSVLRAVAGGTVFVRRARGYVPDSLSLPAAGPPLLAVGAQMKSTICFADAGWALLSGHIGDLGSTEGFACFEETIAHYRRLVGTEPTLIAHDLHPDYRSTRWALDSGLPHIAVQHHHAHVAACLAENDRIGPVTGVAFDGTGYGEDGGLWGGEILAADLGGFERLGHLWPLPLLGGTTAIREPWRLALAALLEAGEELDLLAREGGASIALVRRLYERSIGPRTSSAGRWFDAVAALCGICDRISYDGQAAVELETCAAAGPHPPYEIAFEEGACFTIDLRPAVREIAKDLRHGAGVAVISARFHETMARAILLACQRGRAPSVALTGGCFANRRLTERTRDLLNGDGFEVLLHRRVPPNDGGIAFGQAAVASFRMR